ncbi:MAG: serpin family protein [Candidatus Eisenbacteria bacterium]|nr:serpin family protein [Candidatus Eisenbacteria bacterium]
MVSPLVWSLVPRGTAAAAAILLLGAFHPLGGADSPAPDPDSVDSRGTVLDLARGNTDFALDLYRLLAAEESTENLFFSPHGVSTALSMTWAGARGETADEMARTLRLPEHPAKTIHAAFATLREGTRSGRSEEGGAEWGEVNGIIAAEGFPIREEYKAFQARQYLAGVLTIDPADPVAAAERIDEWFAEGTAGRIRNLVPEERIGADLVLLLASAVRFTGEWENAFPAGATAESPFHTRDGRTVSVPMMHRTGKYPFAEEEGIRAVELPYRGGAFSFVALLPVDPDGFPSMEGRLEGDLLHRLFERLEERRVEVVLPRLLFDLGLDLTGTLRAMGMERAFTPGADFSGISARGGLSIDRVLHRAFLEMDERGAEAAAGTAVTLKRGAPPGPAVLFRADRPFLFLIREREYGSVLFLGRAADPAVETDRSSG